MATNELQLADITEHPTAQKKLCLSAVSLFRQDRRLSMVTRMKSSLAVAALENAVRARRCKGQWCIRVEGPSSSHGRFVGSLSLHGPTELMGRVGACANNAAVESSFSLLQNSDSDPQRWRTRQDLGRPSQTASTRSITAGDSKYL